MKKGVTILKGIRNEYLFCQRGIQKCKGLDIGCSLPVPNFVEYPPPPQKRNKVGREK